jgi:hypothetical protein
MRQVFKFNLMTVGANDVYDSDLEIAYIDIDGEETKIEAEEGKYDLVKVFSDIAISKSIKLVSVLLGDNDPKFYLKTRTKEVKVGYLNSNSLNSYKYFPVNPNKKDIENLEYFLERIETAVKEIQEEMRTGQNRMFYLGDA